MSSDFNDIDYANLEWNSVDWAAEPHEKYVDRLKKVFGHLDWSNGKCVINITANIGEFDLALAEAVSDNLIGGRSKLKVILNDTAYTINENPTKLGKATQDNIDKINNIKGVNAVISELDATSLDRNKIKNYAPDGVDFIFDINGIVWYLSREANDESKVEEFILNLSEILNLGGRIIFDYSPNRDSTGKTLMDLYENADAFEKAMEKFGFSVEILSDGTKDFNTERFISLKKESEPSF